MTLSAEETKILQITRRNVNDKEFLGENKIWDADNKVFKVWNDTKKQYEVSFVWDIEKPTAPKIITQKDCFCGIGRPHKSMSEYWMYHNPNVPSDYFDFNIRGIMMDEEEMKKTGGIEWYVSVCTLCQGVQQHKSSCISFTKGWRPPSPTSAGGGMGTGGIIGNFQNPFNQQFQPSEEYERERKRKEEEMIAKEKARQEAEKKLLGELNAWLDEKEKVWTEYLENGIGIEISPDINKKIEFRNRENGLETWENPFLFTFITKEYLTNTIWTVKEIDSVIKKGEELPSLVEYSLTDEDKVLILKEPKTSKDVEELSKVKDGKFDRIICYGKEYANKNWDKTYWHQLINKEIQIVISKKKEDLSWDAKKIPKQPKKVILNLKKVPYFIRQEPIVPRTWKQYWKEIKRNYDEFSPSNLTITAEKRKKLDSIRKKIRANMDYNFVYKDLILQELAVLIGERPREEKGYFDDVYKRKGENPNTTEKLVITDKDFMIGTNPINFSDYPILDGGKIKLKNFPNLTELTIENLGNLDGELGTKGLTKVDIGSTAPNLQKISLYNCRNLTELILGKKVELNLLDIRWTSLKELDLTQTYLYWDDYGKKGVPTYDRNNEDLLTKPFSDVGFESKIRWSALPKRKELKYGIININNMLKYNQAFDWFLDDVRIWLTDKERKTKQREEFRSEEVFLTKLNIFKEGTERGWFAQGLFKISLRNKIKSLEGIVISINTTDKEYVFETLNEWFDHLN